MIKGRTKDNIRLYAAEDFAHMRAAGAKAAQILDEVAERVQPGVSTAELNDFIETRIAALGAQSATIGYRGYRHASCISINHTVCHGVPSDRRLAKGDILNIDVTVIVDGWYGDSSRMYAAGPPPRRAERLMQVTHDALMLAVREVRPGATFGDVGWAIEKHARHHRMSVVREFCGHGLGREFHLPPNVLHFGSPGTGPELREGMFFTIEPMINLGKPETRILPDGWTAVTRDRSLSAQFEHSVGVTRDGCEVFTLSPGGKYYPANWQPRSR
ncbi:MAG: type I methionyl aminopeptidase [Rhodobacteraceae bacterium]|nr:type I methionyl aminopeptidase [Paracoccaceae bacterium]